MPSYRDGKKIGFVPELQADVLLNQASPVSGTLYEVLAATPNCEILDVKVRVVWTVQPTPLQVHFTVDGQSFYLTVGNPVSNTFYEFGNWDGGDEHGSLVTVSASRSVKETIVKGKSIRIQAETTGGTVSSLYCRVRYRIWD